MDDGDFGGDVGVGSDGVRAAVLHQLRQYVIAAVGPTHRVVTVNAALLRVLGGFNPVGLELVDFLEGAQGQGLIDIYDRAFAGQPTDLKRTRFVVSTPQGYQEEIIIDFEVSPLRNRQGEIVGTVGTGRDTTATVLREEAEAATTAELTRRFQRATDVIAEVQRALLPSRLPVLPGLEVSASYSIGGAEQAAGGDWFDVLPLPGNVVAAVVGDVVGHGVDASAVMAQLRAVTLERLHAGADPAQVVAALDRFVEVMPGARGSTICVVSLDVADGRLQYCSAGHPPPLITGPAGASMYLDPSGAGPLGEGGPRTMLTGQLERERVLLLYTDGIIERPGVPVTQGTVELRQIAEAALRDELFPVFSLPAAVDRSTTQVLERLTRETGASDDITLLALQRAPALTDLSLETKSTGAGGVRQALRACFRPDQVDGAALAELDQIVTELCENAAEHAYDGAGGPVGVDAGVDQRGMLVLQVTDQGSWRPRTQVDDGRGIGLALIQQLSESVSIEYDRGPDDGTQVRVEYRPWKQSNHADPRRPVEHALVADVFLEPQADQNVLRVSGPIDAATTGELEAQLALCITPGSPTLVLDLQKATMLSSTAVRTVRRSLDRAGSAGVHMRVSARPGSVAHQILALVAIPTDG
ncbi:hypothetical protein Kisp01_60490 [Kineosporia sp. NBRC 101677]|uniref:SpoIIE family protein phosphatase n=1 Tax=Kineosporia sp. NBRC 101677 TaxID=3032197 RepID=UPI0024A3ADA5|nr:SpoIIE family protein phosphatase [Kineosporia sp. NBRC 101677]GLY19035.1 hypothetical protein Kisp01_60490 [Kineosporia sp. NBRC 101677]